MDAQGEEDRFGNRIAAAACMPKDVLFGVPVLTITGDAEACIENYRGILEYTDTLIRIRTKQGQIRITGKRLKIEYYTNSEMKVSGRLHCLEFTDGGNAT